MDLDEFEKMVDEAEISKIRKKLTDEELDAEINHDMALWSANQERKERGLKENVLEDEFEKAGPFDPFAEHDYHPADWHKIGDVLDDKKKNEFDFLEKMEDEDEVEDESFDIAQDEDDFDFDKANIEDIKIEDLPNLVPDKELEYHIKPAMAGNVAGEEEQTKPVPFKAETEAGWMEEPLEDDDEPVFYEEPV